MPVGTGLVDRGGLVALQQFEDVVTDGRVEDAVFRPLSLGVVVGAREGVGVVSRRRC